MLLFFAGRPFPGIQVIAAGGLTTGYHPVPLSHIYEYREDPDSFWLEAGLTRSCWLFEMLPLPHGVVLAAGGVDGHARALFSSQQYNPVLRRWRINTDLT